MSKKTPFIFGDRFSEQEDYLSRRFSGKLLTQKEIPLQKNIFERLLARGYFSSTPSINRTHFGYECQRCLNKKRSLIGFMPCLLGNKDFVYCRKCIEMGRVISCEPLYYWTGKETIWPELIDACLWQGQLTDQQLRAAKRITRAIKDKEKEVLIWGVCGSGKTEMLFPGIEEALRQGKRVCIATPRADVVRELLPRFKASFSNLRIQGLYGGSRDNDGTTQLILATTHQLLRYQAAFDLLIIDEIDAFPYHNDPSLPFASNRAKKKDSTTIYLTATPRLKQHRQIRKKELPYVFVSSRFHGHPLPVPRLKMCFTLQKDLAQFLPPSSFLRDLKSRTHKERQILIFVSTIKLAEKMTQNLVPLLIAEKIISEKNRLQSVHAEDKAREEKVELFRKKEITVLLTTTILERGVTFPAIDVFVFDSGHDIFDEAALVQIAGRAGRSPSDPTGDVIFYHEGKTKAMIQAVKSIMSMNKRGGFN